MILHALLRNVMITMALALFFPVSVDHAPTRVPPTWRAGDAIAKSELIAVVNGPGPGRFFSTSEVFVDGSPARIQQYRVVDVLCGDVDEETDIVVAQPRSHMKGYANIMRGESLLFLRRMEKELVEQLREGTPDWADELPDEVWTFVEEEEQWMNWVQFTTIRPNGEINERLRSILAAQLKRFANIEPEREAVLEYIKQLIVLRQAVLANTETPEREVLDQFERDVIRAVTADGDSQ